MDNSEDIEQLSLIGVKTLDLCIKDGVRRDFDTRSILDKGQSSQLVLIFDLVKLAIDIDMIMIGIREKLLQLFRLGIESVSDQGSEIGSEIRVGDQQEAAM